jgi:hypothetical protein
MTAMKKMGIGSGFGRGRAGFGDWLPRSPLMGQANLTQ